VTAVVGTYAGRDITMNDNIIDGNLSLLQSHPNQDLNFGPR
jgi:hypothetical protein